MPMDDIVMIHNFNNDNDLLSETGASCVAQFVMRVLPHYCAMNWLLIMAADRCVAINYPFWYDIHVGRNQVLLIISLFFVYHAVYVASFFYFYNHIPGKCAVFRITPESRGMPKWWTDYVFIGMKVNLILSVLLCAQSVFLVFRVSDQIRSLKSNRDNKRNILQRVSSLSNSIKNVKITIYLLFIYIFLYAPKTLDDIPYFRRMEQNDRTGFEVYVLISEVLVHMNSCVNIFVYAAAKKSNRETYKWMLTHWPWHWTEMETVMRERSSTLAVSASNRGDTLRNTRRASL